MVDIPNNVNSLLSMTKRNPSYRREFREHVSERARVLNKRFQRLENAGLTESPSYRAFMQQEGGRKFGLTRDGRRIDDREALFELKRIERFLSHSTNTVTGATDELAKMANRWGVEYNDRQEIQRSASRLYEISNKLLEYNKSAGMGYVVGTDEIQRIVANFMETNPEGADVSVDLATRMLTDYDLYAQQQEERRRQLQEDIDSEDSQYNDYLM